MEKSVEHIEDEVNWLYATFPQQQMTELIGVLKKEPEAAEKCHIYCQEFHESENREVRDQHHYIGLCQEYI